MEGLIRESREWPEGIDAAELRRRAPGAYMANNELDPDAAEELLEDGEADLVSFGRAYIANPDLVERIAHRRPARRSAEKVLVRRRRHRLLGLAGRRAAAHRALAHRS